MTKKKYIILFIIIVILLISIFIITDKKDENLNENQVEKVSRDYKIIEDEIVLNNVQKETEEVPQISSPQEIDLKNNELTLSSLDFQNLESIPSKFTCDGDNINPNLKISGVDEKAKSLVLIMDDIDISDDVWTHWVKFNISIETREITEGDGIEGISGKGTGGNLNYMGPCPPSGKHIYTFKLYALDVELTLPEGSSKIEVEEAMGGHILQTSELMGIYEREINLIEEKEEVIEE